MSKYIIIFIKFLSIYSDLTFPDFVKDNDYRNLMTKMLTKDINKRLCKFDQIASHNWFKDFSFDELISFNMKPPYLPKIENKENKCKTKPYLDYINGLPEWQPEEDMEGIINPTKKHISDFDRWLKSF